MEKNIKQVITGDSGTITIENVSQNPTKTLFKVSVNQNGNGKKSLLKRIVDAFKSNSSETQYTIYLDRIPAKNLSGYIYNHVTSADKAYKAGKALLSDSMIPEKQDKAKKPTKSRKPKKSVEQAENI